MMQRQADENYRARPAYPFPTVVSEITIADRRRLQSMVLFSPSGTRPVQENASRPLWPCLHVNARKIGPEDENSISR